MYNTERIKLGVFKKEEFDFCESTNPFYTSEYTDSRIRISRNILVTQSKYRILIITLYRRSSTVSTQEFIAMVEQLLSSTSLLHAEILIVGDFNDDLMHNTTKISSWLERNGFNQLIYQLTTDQGSLLDHVYFNGVSLIQTEVCDTYYSDHDCTIIAIASTRSQS